MSTALTALACFGSRKPLTRGWGAAVFGADLNPSLPEDEFDLQPLVSDPFLLVADVRLDNQRELARSLSISPRDLDTMADSALLTRAWTKWGAATLARIIGDFAIAVYSSAERTVWLARSIGGNRPLFYARVNSGLAFASMPSGLLSDPSLRKGFCLERIAAGLVDQPIGDDDRSYFSEIRRVLPGQTVIVSPDRVIQEPIWEPCYEELQFKSHGEFVEEYRSLLDEAVECRLRRTSSHIASQLSAGFDSNAVTATVAKLIGTKAELLAMTAAPREGYDGPSFADRPADETPFAELAARAYGIRHVVSRPSVDVLELFRSQASLYQDPFRNVLNSTWDLALKRIASRFGANVVLTGELGNLSLNAGSLDTLSDLIRRGQWVSWVREVGAAWPTYSLRSILRASLEPLAPSRFSSFIRRQVLGQSSALATSFLRREWGSRLRQPSHQSRLSVQCSAERRFVAIREFDSGTVRKGSLAETGVDTRDPLADRRIIDFSLSLPPEQLFSNGVASPLARVALADRVPEQILQRRIRGFQSADWHEWFSSAVAAELLEEISASPTASQLIDIDDLGDAIHHWPADELKSASVVRRYTTNLPVALAAGLFFRHFESSGLV